MRTTVLMPRLNGTFTDAEMAAALTRDPEAQVQGILEVPFETIVEKSTTALRDLFSVMLVGRRFNGPITYHLMGATPDGDALVRVTISAFHALHRPF